jgi:orotate phosphoribosyltransferase
LSAVHSSDVLEILVDELQGLIAAEGVDLDQYDAVVSPKLGNVLLGSALAQRLQKPSGFIRHSILFGKYLETMTLPGAKLLLVDDVSSEARILTDCVRNARDGGFTIDLVLTVVDRAEGDAARELQRRDVRLLCVRRYSDRELAEQVRALRTQVRPR